MMGFFYDRTIFIYMLEDVYLNKVLGSLLPLGGQPQTPDVPARGGQSRDQPLRTKQ